MALPATATATAPAPASAMPSDRSSHLRAHKALPRRRIHSELPSSSELASKPDHVLESPELGPTSSNGEALLAITSSNGEALPAITSDDGEATTSRKEDLPAHPMVRRDQAVAHWLQHSSSVKSNTVLEHRLPPPLTPPLMPHDSVESLQRPLPSSPPLYPLADASSPQLPPLKAPHLAHARQIYPQRAILLRSDDNDLSSGDPLTRPSHLPLTSQASPSLPVLPHGNHDTGHATPNARASSRALPDPLTPELTPPRAKHHNLRHLPDSSASPVKSQRRLQQSASPRMSQDHLNKPSSPLVSQDRASSSPVVFPNQASSSPFVPQAQPSSSPYAHRSDFPSSPPFVSCSDLLPSPLLPSQSRIAQTASAFVSQDRLSQTASYKTAREDRFPSSEEDVTVSALPRFHGRTAPHAARVVTTSNVRSFDAGLGLAPDLFNIAESTVVDDDDNKDDDDAPSEPTKPSAGVLRLMKEHGIVRAYEGAPQLNVQINTDPFLVMDSSAVQALKTLRRDQNVTPQIQTPVDGDADAFWGRSQSLRTRIDATKQQQSFAPLLDSFAEEIEWPLSDSDLEMPMDVKRLSHMSNTSTVVEAVVKSEQSSPSKPQRLRHSSKMLSLRTSDPETLPMARERSNYRNSAGSNDSRAPRLQHKTGRLPSWGHRTSATSDSGLTLREEIPQANQPPTDAVIMGDLPPKGRSLAPRLQKERPTNADEMDFGKTFGGHDNGYFPGMETYPLASVLNVPGMPSPTDTAETPETVVLIAKEAKPSTERLPETGTREAPAADRPKSPTMLPIEGFHSQLTSSSHGQLLPASRDGLPVARPVSMHARTPFSMASVQSSTPGPWELNEATAISIMPHTNRSLLVVQHFEPDPSIQSTLAHVAAGNTLSAPVVKSISQSVFVSLDGAPARRSKAASSSKQKSIAPGSSAARTSNLDAPSFPSSAQRLQAMVDNEEALSLDRQRLFALTGDAGARPPQQRLHSVASSAAGQILSRQRSENSATPALLLTPPSPEKTGNQASDKSYASGVPIHEVDEPLPYSGLMAAMQWAFGSRGPPETAFAGRALRKRGNGSMPVASPVKSNVNNVRRQSLRSRKNGSSLWRPRAFWDEDAETGKISSDGHDMVDHYVETDAGVRNTLGLPQKRIILRSGTLARRLNSLRRRNVAARAPRAQKPALHHKQCLAIRRSFLESAGADEIEYVQRIDVGRHAVHDGYGIDAYRAQIVPTKPISPPLRMHRSSLSISLRRMHRSGRLDRSQWTFARDRLLHWRSRRRQFRAEQQREHLKRQIGRTSLDGWSGGGPFNST